MSAPTFLLPHAALAVGDEVVLDGAEGRHAVAVRRVQRGERVDLTDGAGLRLECVVSSLAGKDAAHLTVLDRVAEPAPSPRFVVVQAIPKGDRGELAVEVMTEAGVDAIVPWAASRCVTQWKGERGVKSAQRWQRTAVEASKQAHRSWLPDIAPPASTADVVRAIEAADLAIVLHEEATEPLASVELPSAGDVLVVVGPEGGISPAELAAFRAAGASIARLGPTVLRTSTAGVVALGVLLARTPRWS